MSRRCGCFGKEVIIVIIILLLCCGCGCESRCC
ncbi:hypothetical protein WY13_00565 [Clostridium ljungdahlii]|uniref:Uncharacterized protein n=1 Tax=Clostridium ljungdahlii TaxID=1538 RepID=A0A166S3Y3_9CLOT|nr:hypothetical protein WY13_00565 [Clostridium ljungdahlii]